MAACPDFNAEPWKGISNAFGRDAVYTLSVVFDSESFQRWKGDNRFPRMDDNYNVFSNEGDSVHISDILSKYSPDIAQRRINKYVPGVVRGSEISSVLKNIINHSSNPEYKEIASTLLEKSSLVSDVKIILQDPDPDSSTAFVNAGSYNYGDSGKLRSISLNPDLFTKENVQVEQIILHEIIHAYTSEVLVDPRISGLERTEEEKAFANRIDSLLNIARSAMIEKIQNKPESERTPFERTVLLANESDTTRDLSFVSRVQGFKTYYGLSNSREFVTEIMTNPEFRDEMQSLRRGNIWTRFVNVVRRLLGLQTTETDIVGEAVDSILDYIGGMERVARIEGFQRVDFAVDPNDESLDPKVRAIDKILRTLHRRARDLQRKEISPESQATRRQTEGLIKRIEDAEQDRALVIGVDDAYKTASRLYNELESAYENNNLSFALINRVVRIANGIDYLDDTFQLINRTPELKKKHSDLLERIEAAQRLIRSINRNYNEISRALTANRLSRVDLRTEKEFQNRFEGEFGERDTKKYPTEQEFLVARAQYVSEQFKENAEEIELAKKQRIDKELRLGQRDVGSFAAFVKAFQDIGDDIIAMTKQILDRATNAVRIRYNPIERKLTKLHRELREFKGATNPDILYEDIVELDSDGNKTGYYVSEYRKGEFQNTIQEFREEIEDLSPHEKNKAWSIFFRENYVQEFTDEWLEEIDSLTIEQSPKYREIQARIKDLLKPYQDFNDSHHYHEVPIETWEEIKKLNNELRVIREKNPNSDRFFEIATFQPRKEWDEANARKKEELTEEEYREWREAQFFTNERGERQLLGQWTRLVPTKREFFNENWDGTQKLRDKWRNPQFDRLQEFPEDHIVRRYYDYVIGLSEQFDKKRPHDKRLGFRIPAMRKTALESFHSGDISMSSIRDQIEQGLFVVEDDIEFGEKALEKRREQEEENFAFLDEDAEGRTNMSVPIFFTHRMPIEKMSFDITTATARNAHMSLNYEEKRRVAPELETVQRVVEQREVIDRDFRGRKFRTPSGIRTIKGDDTNVYKSIVNLLEKELYGIQSKDYPLSKLFERLYGYTSKLLMGGNVRASITNLSIGQTMQNVYLRIGGVISRKALNNAYSYYIANAHRNVADMGDSFKTSPINILHEEFDGLTDFRGPRFDYLQEGRLKRLATDGSIYHGGTNLGEHFNYSITLLGILNDTLVYDENGNFLTLSGDTTDDVSRAMSLFDSYTFENGEANIDPRVKKVQLKGRIINWDSEARFRITNWARGINKNVQGAYASHNRGEIYRHLWPKAIVQMRGWLLPHWDRRFRGAFNLLADENRGETRDWFEWELTEHLEGYYTSLAKHIKHVIFESKSLNLFANSHWEELSKLERANVLRAAMEISILMISTALFHMVLGAAEEEDDELQQEGLRFAAYQLARFRAEIGFYVWPPAMMDIVNDPAASLSVVRDLTTFGLNLLTPTQRYEAGDRAGELKLRRRAERLFPIWRQLEALGRSQDFINYYTWN